MRGTISHAGLGGFEMRGREDFAGLHTSKEGDTGTPAGVEGSLEELRATAVAAE
jgi:hypothetical protein